MKKMSRVCMAVMCLAMQGLSTPQGRSWLEDCLTLSEQEAESLRVELKDAKKLRERTLTLCSGSMRIADLAKTAEEFKKKFDISDKVLQDALIDTIREWSPKNGWKWYELDKPQDSRLANFILIETIRWLGFCAEREGKKLLMAILIDNTKDDEYRRRAIDSYMRRSDAQERWDALTRFLADDVKPTIQPIFDVYYAAMWEYDSAENDPQKREAIIAAVSAALLKEKGKETFTQGDKLLAERSKAYADSPQRKAALERLNIPIEKGGQ